MMISTRVLALLLLLIVGLCWSFDKNLMKKGRKSAGYEKPSILMNCDELLQDLSGKDKTLTCPSHPISRRVLRFDRSADFPQPGELPFPMLDFAKILPDIPVKFKPSHVNPDADYQPELEF